MRLAWRGGARKSKCPIIHTHVFIKYTPTRSPVTTKRVRCPKDAYCTHCRTQAMSGILPGPCRELLFSVIRKQHFVTTYHVAVHVVVVVVTDRRGITIILE